MCDKNHSWKRWLAQRDLKWNLKWNHSVHSKANSNVIIALFSTFGGLIVLFLIWLYYEHRKSANITENCRRLGKILPYGWPVTGLNWTVQRPRGEVDVPGPTLVLVQRTFSNDPLRPLSHSQKIVLLEGWNLINFSLSWNCEFNPIRRKASIQVSSIKKGVFLKRQITEGFSSSDSNSRPSGCLSQTTTERIDHHSHLRMGRNCSRKDLWTEKWSVLMWILEVLISPIWKLFKLLHSGNQKCLRKELHQIIFQFIFQNHFPILILFKLAINLKKLFCTREGRTRFWTTDTETSSDSEFFLIFYLFRNSVSDTNDIWCFLALFCCYDSVDEFVGQVRVVFEFSTIPIIFVVHWS